MKVFIFGVSGAIGGMLADRLVSNGTTVSGLVRRVEQRDRLSERGVEAIVGELETMTSDELAKAIADVSRFILVSVLPESWRERDLGEELEHYFMIKKQADVAVVRSSLDWVILRPSLLLDDPAKGTVSMGPAEIHNDITREDVALTLVELLAEPRISRQILELDNGETPIRDAVQANLRSEVPV